MATDIGTLKGTAVLDDKLSPSLTKGVNATKAFAVGIAAAGAAVVAVGATMVKAAADALAFADSLDNQARATNVSTESLQVLNIAAEQAGQSASSITTGIQRLQRGISEGTTETNEAFQKLGVGVETLKRLNPEQQFRLVLEKLGEMPNATDRAATAMILLGRSGANLQALTGDALPALEARLRGLGLVVEESAVKKMDELELEFDLLKRTGDSLWTNLGTGIATAEGLSFTVDFLTTAFGNLNVWVQQNREEIGHWVNAGILVAAGAIEFTLQFVGAFIAGLGLLGGVMPQLQLAFLDWFKTLLESPIAKFIPGIQTMREGLVTMTETVMSGVQAQVDFFDKTTEVGTAIFMASKKVNDFQANLLTHIENTAAATEVQNTNNISVEAAAAAAEAAALKLATLKGNMDAFLNSTELQTQSIETWKETISLSVEELVGDIFPQAIDSFGQVTAGVGGLESSTSAAFARMGVKTRTELQSIAAQAVRDFDNIKASGLATEAELETANKRKNDAIKEMEGDVANNRVSLAQASLGASSQLLGAFGQKNKAAAIAKATIDTVLAVQRTFAQLGWPAGIPGMAVAAAMGAVNVAKIASSKPGFATGTANLDFAEFGTRTTADLHGKEAIIPRGGGHQLGAEIAASLRTMTPIGAGSSGSMGGGSGPSAPPMTVILQVDGDTFAQWFEDKSKGGNIRTHISGVRDF